MRSLSRQLVLFLLCVSPLGVRHEAAAQSECPANAHVERVEMHGNVRTTYCKCDGGYEKGDKGCARISSSSSVEIGLQAEQDELDRMNAAWLRRQQEQIRAAAAANASWRQKIEAAIDSIEVPSPPTLTQAQPGDVLLLTPEGGLSWNRLVPSGDHIYRAAMYLASGEAFHATHIPTAPVSHGLVVVKSVKGQLFFLDHTLPGSRILTLADFERKYGSRGIYLARPQALVDGRALWQFARRAALDRHSDFGVGSSQVVCTGKCGIAVAIATGLPVGNKRLGPIDLTPGDFFDEQASGKYFVLMPLSHGQGSK